MGVAFSLGGTQAIEVLTPVAFAFQYGPAALSDAISEPHVAAIELRTDSLAGVTEALTGGRIEHAEQHGRIVVPARAAFGVTVAFAAGA